MATKENILRVAQTVEDLGFASVWAFQRLLYAMEFSNEHRFLRPGGGWPKVFERVLDPLQTLALVAAHTSRVRLGTCVINLPYYTPILLAKELATLDVLSDGRVDLGAGIGWSLDELAAVGVDPEGRGDRGNEFLRCLRSIWEDDVVEFEGAYYRVPRSRIEPKPLQRPGPPILVGGYVKAALVRAVTYGDGYIAGAVPFEKLTQLLDTLASLRDEAPRREPFRIVTRVEVQMGQAGPDRSVEALVQGLMADVDRYGDLGVTEIYLDCNQELVGSEDSSAAVDHVLEVLAAVAPEMTTS